MESRRFHGWALRGRHSVGSFSGTPIVMMGSNNFAEVCWIKLSHAASTYDIIWIEFFVFLHRYFIITFSQKSLSFLSKGIEAGTVKNWQRKIVTLSCLFRTQKPLLSWFFSFYCSWAPPRIIEFVSSVRFTHQRHKDWREFPNYLLLGVLHSDSAGSFLLLTGTLQPNHRYFNMINRSSQLFVQTSRVPKWGEKN